MRSTTTRPGGKKSAAATKTPRRPGRPRVGAATSASASYIKLVTTFPLVPIVDDRHLEEAARVIDGLLRRELDEWEEAYLDVLSDLVFAYEEQHHSIPRADPGAVLRHLLEANALTQSQLARDTGIAVSTVSAILSGARRPSGRHAVALGTRFNVSPAAFLSPVPAE